MKKSSILIIAIFIAMGSYAQNMNVQTAFNHLKKGKLKEAIEAIKPALDNAQTSMQAKTWFYYGNICFEIAKDETGIFSNVITQPLDESTRGYTKALEFDKRQEYTEDIARMMSGIAGLYWDKGVTAFEQKSYSQAAEYFTKSYNIGEQVERKDPSQLVWAGNCWILEQNWDKAEEIFDKLKDLNHKDPAVYIGLAKVAVAKKDFNKAVQLLDEGEEKYPKDLGFLTEKANMYMVGELSEMDKHATLNTLLKIIEIEPNNASVWNSLGTCYALDENTFDKAAAAYKKCIELDPKFISAYYGYSNLFLDKANHYIKEAQDLPLDANDKYEKLIKQAEDVFKGVLPFVEQAHTLNPQDGAVKQILKEIYTRLKMLDKAAEIK